LLNQFDKAIRSNDDALIRRETFASRWIDLRGHPSGFDYMRIGLSTSVLLWHSYQISYGTAAAVQVWRTPVGIVLQVILPMFFSLSGFLVFGSLERSRDIRKFLALRAIRIYPALCVEVVACAVILGPIVTSLTWPEYFASRDFFTYFVNMFGWIHYLLPGVFTYNPLPRIVNTSLWTVPYELECYIVLPALVLLGFLRSRQLSLAMFAASTIIVAIMLYRSGESGIPAGGVHGRILLLCFLAGTLAYRFRDLLPYSGPMSLASALVGIVLLRSEYGVFAAPVFVAYATVYLGMLNPTRTVVVDSGDYSYGIYLYAAPIQQTVAWGLGAANNWALNVLIALPATVIFALFSWHFVEKPFSRVKKYILG
jgi:peptidoglycan/LPS O-acetylase OafA/YrhL